MTQVPARRQFLRATAVLAASAGLAGCTSSNPDGASDGQPAGNGTASPESSPASTPEPEDPDAVDATVAVGPDGDLTYRPGTDEPLRVDVGATVRFVWRSDNHNVVVESQPGGAGWEGSPGDSTKLYDDGYSFTHTFETPGQYDFYCQPHRAAGMVGTVSVGDVTPTAGTPTERSEASPTETPLDRVPYEGDAAAVVDVGPGGELVFVPEEVTVAPGETVAWVWQSDNHNVVVESQPGGADWQGTDGDDATTYDRGHVYEHTFETSGRYEYVCVPHETVGMTGSVVVE